MALRIGARVSWERGRPARPGRRPAMDDPPQAHGCSSGRDARAPRDPSRSLCPAHASSVRGEASLVPASTGPAERHACLHHPPACADHPDPVRDHGDQFHRDPGGPGGTDRTAHRDLRRYGGRSDRAGERNGSERAARAGWARRRRHRRRHQQVPRRPGARSGADRGARTAVRLRPAGARALLPDAVELPSLRFRRELLPGPDRR